MDDEFNCKKCNIKINGHNKYIHDGMCDDCYFKEYFPESRHVKESIRDYYIKKDRKKESENIAWIILSAISAVQLGKLKLAEFLKGSKSKDVVMYSNLAGFGGLMWHEILIIEKFIEQLEAMELIRRSQVSEFYSYYVLTAAGVKVLNEKIDVNLQVIKEKKQAEVGESDKITLEMHKLGKSISEIAKERGLVESTIYGHFYNLISNGYVNADKVVSKEKIETILAARKKFGNAQKLSDIKLALPENITYGEIRCVLADKALNN
ncbi:MAG: helix-turn-helix domain-containing protein [archaeon]